MFRQYLVSQRPDLWLSPAHLMQVERWRHRFEVAIMLLLPHRQGLGIFVMKMTPCKQSYKTSRTAARNEL